MEQVQGRPWKGKKHNSTWYPQLDSGQALISCYYVSYDSYDTYIFYVPQMCKRCPGPNYNILSYIVNHDTFIVNIFQVYTSSAEEALRMSIFAQNVAKVTIIVLMMKKNMIVEKYRKNLCIEFCWGDHCWYESDHVTDWQMFQIFHISTRSRPRTALVSRGRAASTSSPIWPSKH